MPAPAPARVAEDAAAAALAVEAAAAVGRAHEEAGLIGVGAQSVGGGGRGGTTSSSSELLPASVEEWVAAALRPGMVHAVHAWASGARFVDVCGLTEAMEGTIVRTVMRVDEVSEGRKRRGGDGDDDDDDGGRRREKSAREREEEREGKKTRLTTFLFLP